MKNNITLEEIGKLLLEAESILMFPHVNPDGDALGSSIALCSALRKEGKESWVVIEEDVPGYIDFLNTGCCTTDFECICCPDISVCIDCGDDTRISNRLDAFKRGRTKLCIDHHMTGESYGDYYYIDESEAATAQIIFRLLNTMGVEIGPDTAEAIYTGIVTDTGSFQHSNTTAETHRIASELLKLGVDGAAVAVALYQNVSLMKIRLQARILDELEIFADGRGALACLDMETLEAAGASEDDAEGMIDLIKSIEGVEIAAFLKEREDSVKVSLRAKTSARVDGIAVKYGGGGHLKAAGCTLKQPLKEAAELIMKDITQVLEN